MGSEPTPTRDSFGQKRCNALTEVFAAVNLTDQIITIGDIGHPNSPHHFFGCGHGERRLRDHASAQFFPNALKLAGICYAANKAAAERFFRGNEFRKQQHAFGARRPEMRE